MLRTFFCAPGRGNNCRRKEDLMLLKGWTEVGKGAEECPELSAEQKKGLQAYHAQFRFDW